MSPETEITLKIPVLTPTEFDDDVTKKNQYRLRLEQQNERRKKKITLK